MTGDIHQLNQEDGSFDFLFSNVFDHALYPDQFCSEMERVTRAGGIILLHLQLHRLGDQYTETVVYKPHHVIRLFSLVRVRESRPVSNSFDSMNWELVLEKTASPQKSREEG